MNSTQTDLRIAWLVPSAEAGAYWQPILREFAKHFNHTFFYTTNVWPGFNPNAPEAYRIKSLGKLNVFLENQSSEGYKNGLMYLPMSILKHLFDFKPHVIISNAFSMWALLAVALKPIFRWKIIVLYEGSTPQSDFKDSNFRSFFRRFIAKHANAFIANSKAARAYLEEFLDVKSELIFPGPYLVPDSEQTLIQFKEAKTDTSNIKHPVFLFVGRLIERKGIHKLLEACAILKAQGLSNFTLIVVGDGDDRAKFEALAQEKGLEEQIIWKGWVAYELISEYFQTTDLFVFPSFEDTWGIVILEAMAFGKPVICSQWAGASEMVIDGENGYLFDPHTPEQLAALMQRFIEQPELITEMGQRAQQLIAPHTPEKVTGFFKQIILRVTNPKKVEQSTGI